MVWLVHIQKRKLTAFWKGLVFAAAVSLLLSACGREYTSDEGLNETIQIDNGFVDDVAAAAKGGAYAATEKELEALGRMELILSNEYLELYMGDYYDIAVRDQETGAVWFSNQAIYDYEANAELTNEGLAAAYSQVTLQYYDSTNKEFALSSYPDCVDGRNKDTVDVRVEGDKVTVTYDFGIKDLDKTICTAFTVEDFEKLDAIANQKIEEGTLSMVDYQRFYHTYIKVDVETFNSAELQVYLNQYPALKEWGVLYVLQTPTTDVTKTINAKVSPILGIDEAYIDAQMEKIGMEKNAISNSMFFEIPVTYQLDGRDLLASIETEKIINGEGGYRLTRVDLLNSFGAGKKSDPGYVFIPDGSGAVIENGSTTTGQFDLDLPFFGTDFCVDVQSGDEVSPYAPLPVFGARTGEKGFFGIVESGDALGGVTAQVPNSNTPYNTVYPWLTYYSQDVNADGNYVYAVHTPEEDFTVRYHLLYGEGSTYSGMARYYQAYLLQTGQLGDAEVQQTLPLNLNFVGAITKKQMVWGVPQYALSAASTFEDIRRFAETLDQAGVKQVDYVLIGAMNGGMDFRIPSKVQLEKVIGGEEGYHGLVGYLNSVGSRASLSVDFTRVYEKGNGLNQNVQISRYIDKEVAFVSDFDPADLTKGSQRSAYLLNPLSYAVVADSFIREDAELGNKNIFAASLGSYLSSNFNDKSFVGRGQSRNLSRSVLKQLGEAGYRVMIDGGSQYAIPYADFVTDIPIDSGNFSIESYAVPFVGMVLHGYVDYSGPALNKQSNYEMSLLQNIESGAGLNYWLMTADPMLFSQTAYTDLYNISAESWEADILKTYKELNEAFQPLASCTITDHRTLQENVVQTTYSNGTRILVNYNKESVSVPEAGEIGALDWMVIQGG